MCSKGSLVVGLTGGWKVVEHPGASADDEPTNLVRTSAENDDFEVASTRLFLGDVLPSTTKASVILMCFIDKKMMEMALFLKIMMIPL